MARGDVDVGNTGHGRRRDPKTARLGAHIDASTQSPCCSAESDDTSA